MAREGLPFVMNGAVILLRFEIGRTPPDTVIQRIINNAP